MDLSGGEFSTYRQKLIMLYGEIIKNDLNCTKLPYILLPNLN